MVADIDELEEMDASELHVRRLNAKEVSETIHLNPLIRDCPERGGEQVSSPIKSIPPNTEKWLRKRYEENYNNDMSNETKRETNYSMNNKCNDVNTRNMHIT